MHEIYESMLVCYESMRRDAPDIGMSIRGISNPEFFYHAFEFGDKDSTNKRFKLNRDELAILNVQVIKRFDGDIEPRIHLFYDIMMALYLFETNRDKKRVQPIHYDMRLIRVNTFMDMPYYGHDQLKVIIDQTLRSDTYQEILT